MRRRLRAFSLLEIAIVLIIVGLISSLTFPILTASLEAGRRQKTENHKERLFYCLAGYVLQNGHLPCPGQLSDLPLGSAREKCLENHVGIIPFKTLGINQETAKDGFGNWFTYAVNPALTSPHLRPIHDPLAEATFCTVKTTSLSLLDSPESGQEVLAPTATDHLALVLISHKRQDPSFFEKITMDPIFMLNEEQGSSQQLYWVSRNNLLAMYAHVPCPPVKAVAKPGPAQEKSRLW